MGEPPIVSDPEAPDNEVLQPANARHAVLVTSDRDFGEFVYRQWRVHAGAVLRRLVGSLLVVLAPLLLAGPPPAEAQPPAGTVWRLGYLSPGSTASHAPLFKILREALTERGYTEGRNLAIDYRWAEGRHEQLNIFAAELVRLRPAVIITSGTPASPTLKQATSEIPVVFLGVGDPVGTGLVASFARPGGNLTGFSTGTVEIAAKRLELLREVVPGLARVGVMWNPENLGAVGAAKQALAGARALGVQALPLEVRHADGLRGAFGVAVQEQLGGMLVVEDPMTVVNRKAIAALAAEHRLPAIYGLRQFVDAGGLIAYAPSYEDMYRRAAALVVKILLGTRPADLPVEHPAKLDLVINLQTARALGLTIPPSVLLRADNVIE